LASGRVPVLRALLVAGLVACDGGATRNGAERAVDDVRRDTAVAERTPDAAADSATATVAWRAGDTQVAGATSGSALLRAVRSARHDGFDRIVFEFAGELPGYVISYIDPVRQCGSGDAVALAGTAWLSLRFEPAAAHTEEGVATVTERSRSPGLPSVVDLRLICDFEAQVEWVAGVRERLEYRVITLREPARIVVDVRHAKEEGE
jgi:hypothetical protein